MSKTNVILSITNKNYLTIKKILKNPGISVSELAKLTTFSQQDTTRQLQKLEKYKIIRCEYEKGKKGIKKKSYPTIDKFIIYFMSLFNKKDTIVNKKDTIHKTKSLKEDLSEYA